MTVPERVERCGYTVEPVLNRDGTFNPITGQMRISEGGGHTCFPALLYAELTDDGVFMRVMNQAFFIPDDWAPPSLHQGGAGSAFLRPPAAFNGLIDAALNARPVEPRLQATKLTAYASVSREQLDEATSIFRTPTPEEAAESHKRWLAHRAQKQADHAAAVAEWEALRQQHAGSPAVLAVLDIHRPDDEGRLECAHPVFGWESDAEDWPCSTYTAIKEATP